MNDHQTPKAPALFSMRRLGLASGAAFLGCAACCAVPFLAAAGLGGGAVAALARILRPGSELLVGTAVFVVVLGVLVLRERAKRGVDGAACSVDGGCRARGR